MIKVISYSLISIVLFATTPLKELAKLPLLIEHFIEHVEANPHLDIVSFLNMHYFNGDPIDEDYEEDMKLPFKTLDFSSSVVFLIIPSFHEAILPYVSKIVTNLTSPNYKNDFSKSAALSSIWQPPKIL